MSKSDLSLRLQENDTLIYSIDLINYCKAQIIGVRDGNSMGIKTIENPTFLGMLRGIMDYHVDCFMAYSQGRSIELVGASCAESGWYEDRSLNFWELKLRTPLPTEEKRALEGLVRMHNEYVDYVRGTERLALKSS